MTPGSDRPWRGSDLETAANEVWDAEAELASPGRCHAELCEWTIMPYREHRFAIHTSREWRLTAAGSAEVIMDAVVEGTDAADG